MTGPEYGMATKCNNRIVYLRTVVRHDVKHKWIIFNRRNFTHILTNKVDPLYVGLTIIVSLLVKAKVSLDFTKSSLPK